MLARGRGSKGQAPGEPEEFPAVGKTGSRKQRWLPLVSAAQDMQKLYGPFCVPHLGQNMVCDLNTARQKQGNDLPPGQGQKQYLFELPVCMHAHFWRHRVSKHNGRITTNECQNTPICHMKNQTGADNGPTHTWEGSEVSVGIQNP